MCPIFKDHKAAAAAHEGNVMPSAGGDGGGFLNVDGLGARIVDAEDPVVGVVFTMKYRFYAKQRVI